MPELTAKRTLVKSPPELWEELSEAERLAKHLGAFGEIKITKLDPEHTVAWEGEHASGMVSMEPSGWGTRVTLTAELAADSGEAAADSGQVAGRDEVEVARVDRGHTDGEPEADPQEAVHADPYETVDTDPHQTPGADPHQAVVADPEQADDTEPPTQEPSPVPEEEPPRRRGFWARLFGDWLRGERWRGFAAPAPTRAASTASEAKSGFAEPAMSGTPVPGPVVEKVEHEPAAAVPEDDENEPTTAAQDNDLATEVDAPAAPAEIQALDEPEAIDADHAQSVLEQTLDALGSAHHRPFSRG